MLEEMGQARNAGRIVHRAHLEPQHLGDDRGAMIGDHQHLHAVLQRELKSLCAACWRVGWRRGRREARRKASAVSESSAAEQRS